MHKFTLLLLPLALAACGEGSSFDESLKATYREQLVSTCTATAGGQIPASVEIDLDKLCACAADKVMAGKSAKDLVTTPPGSAEDLARVQECVKEIGPVKINTAG